jgi:hypothetical protein
MATQNHENNYVLGKGEVYFGRFGANVTEHTGERYIGNTPELNATIESEKLEHKSSDRGISETDKTVILEVSRSATMICDNIDRENLALFFFGTADVLTVAQTTVTDEQLGEVRTGHHYQLGETLQNPSGARGIIYPGVVGPPLTTFLLKKGATTLVHGTDYLLEAELGRVEILRGGAVIDGDELTATYTISPHNRDVVISGSTSVEGSLRLIARNPAGKQTDVYMPYVSISPNGDFALKTDEWQQLSFNIDVLKKGNLEAYYLDGRPYTPTP